DGGHLLHGQLDLEDVAAGLIPGLAGAGLSLTRSQGLADVPVPLANAAGALLAVAELRDFDLRQGNADQVLALLPDELAAANVLAQVALHLAADKLAEALVITLDPLTHGSLSSRSGRRTDHSPLLLDVAASEDAGHEAQHVGRAHVAVSIIADQ